MKFICLGYLDGQRWQGLSEGEQTALIDECFAYDDTLRAGGHFLGGEALQDPQRAVTLRHREGRVVATEGPCAQTQEDLGGILILEAKDLDQALTLMSRHPGVKMGAFEIRPAEDLSALVAASARRRGVSVRLGRATPKIRPCLWYAEAAEEAAAFYASIFPDSRVLRVTPLLSESPGGPPGSVKVVEFELFGQPFMAFNAGLLDPFNHAVSFVVSCEDQAELDRYWNALLEGGTVEECGWLKDRYGVSWQIAPTALGEMMADPDPARAKRASDAMLRMVKLDIAALQAAFAGTTAGDGPWPRRPPSWGPPD